MQSSLQNVLKQIAPYRIALFILLLVGMYGFLVWRVSTLANVEPDSTAVAAKAPPARPKIDKATLDKIKQLQDGSVNVQTLFNQARQNPFQE
jgi:hypothetical protein